jgi:hypothetical protein
VGPAGVPVPLESELVCALAGKANIAAENDTIIRLRKSLGEITRHMSRPCCEETNTLASYRLSGLNRLIWINAGRLTGYTLTCPPCLLYPQKSRISFPAEGAGLAVDCLTPPHTINHFESAVFQQRRIKISYLPAMRLYFMAHRLEAGEGQHPVLGRQFRSKPHRSRSQESAGRETAVAVLARLPVSLSDARCRQRRGVFQSRPQA